MHGAFSPMSGEGLHSRRVYCQLWSGRPTLRRSFIPTRSQLALPLVAFNTVLYY